MSSDFRDRFWHKVCMNDQFLILGMMFSVVLLVLSLATYPFVDRNSATYVIVVIDIVMMSGLFALCAGMLTKCRRRRE